MASSSASSSTGSFADDRDWDDWVEHSAQRTRSLFAPGAAAAGGETAEEDQGAYFDTPELALQHDKSSYGVDVVLVCSSLDFFERIRLINWIRSTRPEPAAVVRLDRSADFLSDDAYLKPVLEDDPLLQVDYDDLLLRGDSSAQPADAKPSAALREESSELVDALRAQVADLTLALNGTRRALEERVGVQRKDAEGEQDTASEPKGKGKERDDDTHYFESYAYNDIHEIMIKDRIRTDSYRDFIVGNPSVLKGATVLDVGCGSGILSMFAAQAGAKRVYAVDASAIAFKAERNVKANGLSDVVKVIKGKIEDIQLPEKVDIVISEWMGYFLLYESMLDSVLVARERFLRPGGLMAPSQCSIVMSLMDGSALVRERVQFWDDVYGFKMPDMATDIYDEGLIDTVGADEVASERVPIKHIDTGKSTPASLSFSVPFSLRATRATKVHAFLGWFDTYFTRDGRVVPNVASETSVQPAELESGEIFFSTGPGAQGEQTHWKQTVFLLRKPFEVKQGTLVEGHFRLGKSDDNSRELVVEVTWRVEQGDETAAQVWKVR